MNLNLFASCPRYLESLLKQELITLGAKEVAETQAGNSLSAGLAVAYRICLWSRLASRLFLKLAQFPITSAKSLYGQSQKIKWEEHFSTKETFSVKSHVSHSCLTHSHYAGLKLKDAIVDYFRQKTGTRPSVDLENPDIRLYLHLNHNIAVIYLDLSGQSLHKRGYRLNRAKAPLRENTAAALLIKARWPEISRKKGGLIDPMCGSGTLAIEAALLAGDIAPGLLRPDFGFTRWKKHDPLLWQTLLNQAKERREAGSSQIPPLLVSDIDRHTLDQCRENIKRAGLEPFITVVKSNFIDLDLKNIALQPPGLLVSNPPYGKRLDTPGNIKPLYNQLGQWLKNSLPQWQASILCADKETAHAIGLRAIKINTFYNGSLKCYLAHFRLDEANQFQSLKSAPGKRLINQDPTSGIMMIVNRLKKNARQLKKYLKTNQITCYRLYDADIPQHACAIDVYENKYVVIQEYAPPPEIEPARARKRFEETIAAVRYFFQLENIQIFIKQRKQQKGKNQYKKLASSDEKILIRENQLNFYVNFQNYLDTGIFLDHRLTRRLIGELSEGKKVLNLFAYTCTATVYAARGGALRTVSVDTSHTYLEWGEKNMQANQIKGNQHGLIQQDCLEYLKNGPEVFDLIFIDPPTFSNRKDRQMIFDLQKDHALLIELALKRLSPQGSIIFSCHYRKFKLDPHLRQSLQVEDITSKTIPLDFQRHSKIHQAYLIKK